MIILDPSCQIVLVSPGARLHSRQCALTSRCRVVASSVSLYRWPLPLEDCRCACPDELLRDPAFVEEDVEAVEESTMLDLVELGVLEELTEELLGDVPIESCKPGYEVVNDL